MKPLLALLIGAMALPGADFSGIWLGNVINGRRNLVQDVAFQFKQTGTAISGKLYLDHGSTPILKGSVEGDQIVFYVLAREQDGNQINESLLKFTGVMKDAVSIELTREREELRNAGNAGASFSRAQKQTMMIKRLP